MTTGFSSLLLKLQRDLTQYNPLPPPQNKKEKKNIAYSKTSMVLKLHNRGKDAETWREDSTRGYYYKCFAIVIIRLLIGIIFAPWATKPTPLRWLAN